MRGDEKGMKADSVKDFVQQKIKRKRKKKQRIQKDTG